MFNISTLSEDQRRIYDEYAAECLANGQPINWAVFQELLIEQHNEQSGEL